MRFLFTTLLLLTTFNTFGQKIKLNVKDQRDTTVFLVKYYGNKLLYADTAIIKSGNVEFDGKKQKPGIMGLLLPGQRYFEFIYNNEEVAIETNAKGNFYDVMKVKKSDDNMIFIEYLKFMEKQRNIANGFVEKMNATTKDSPEYIKFQNKLDSLSESVLNYQQKQAKEHENKFVGKIIKASTDISIPKNLEGPQELKYIYYRDHYFDNVDLNDDRLVNTAVFHQKLDFFVNKVIMQIPDSILTYAYKYLDRFDKKSEMFKYWLNYTMSVYEKSNIMGMDKVVIKLGEKYYCNKDANGNSSVTWIPKDKLDEFCKKVNVQKNLLIGCKAPNIALRDTSDTKWFDFYSLNSEYTILYFWEPSCGHCKTTTPKLQRLYEEKLKARNVEVFAVTRGIDDDMKKWKDFTKVHKLTFINVALTDKLYKDATKDANQFIPKFTTIEALNYQTTYDVYSTPRVFILDKDKKIVAKNLSIAQIENFIDKMQNKQDSKVIFPLEEDTEEVNH